MSEHPTPPGDRSLMEYIAQNVDAYIGGGDPSLAAEFFVEGLASRIPITRTSRSV